MAVVGVLVVVVLAVLLLMSVVLRDVLRAIADLKRTIVQQGGRVMAELDDLKQSITDLEASVDEAVVTFGEIKAKLDELLGGALPEPVRLELVALRDRVAASKGKLDTAEEASDITPDA